MSNYLAVATVTATLQRILQASVQGDVDGVRVTTLPPSQIGNGTPQTGINLFLYHVTRNTAFSNADAAPLRAKGTPIKRQAVLDLHYMMSFYGNDAELEPQRLLGSVTRTFNDRASLLPEAILETIADPSFRFLADSDLANQIQQINIYPIDLSLDDLSKTWSVFFQTGYLLSLVYRVTVVTIEGDHSWQRALPVRERGTVGIIPFPNQPLVEQVVAAGGIWEPILTTSMLHIRGKQLQGATTLVRLGGFEVTPTEVSDSQLTLSFASLPVTALQAGIQSLQVIHRYAARNTRSNTSSVESNAMPFVLRPTIRQAQVSQTKGSGDDLRSAVLTVQVDVIVGVKQRVVVALNEWSIVAAVAYQFSAASRPTDTDTVTIPLQEIKPGAYLLRLQIDGAESILSVDLNPESSTFNWYISPKIEIP